MAVLVLPALAVTFLLSYIFRKDGVPLPWSPGTTCNLWQLLVNDSPQSLSSLLLENLATYLPLYTVCHFMLYVEPQRSLFRPFKLNPRYPSLSLIGREMFRSLRGVLICSLYEVLVNQLHRQGSLPSSYTPSLLTLQEDGSISPLVFLLAFSLGYLWGDTHFYWTHRLLHTQWLYKRVHKTHHESYNPDPFSGLSMHWIGPPSTSRPHSSSPPWCRSGCSG